MTIRKMTVDDVRVVIEIGNEASELAVSDESRFWKPDRLNSWVQADEDIMLVAEDNNQVVGAQLTNVHKPSRVCYFSDLVVKESARGQGIGTALIKEALRQCKQLGITYVYGLTQVSNNKIHQLLQKEGFSKGETMIWFEKRLS